MKSCPTLPYKQPSNHWIICGSSDEFDPEASSHHWNTSNMRVTLAVYFLSISYWKCLLVQTVAPNRTNSSSMHRPMYVSFNYVKYPGTIEKQTLMKYLSSDLIKGPWSVTALSLVGGSFFHQVFLIYMQLRRSRDVKYPHKFINKISYPYDFRNHTPFYIPWKKYLLPFDRSSFLKQYSIFPTPGYAFSSSMNKNTYNNFH